MKLTKKGPKRSDHVGKTLLSAKIKKRGATVGDCSAGFLREQLTNLTPVDAKTFAGHSFEMAQTSSNAAALSRMAKEMDVCYFSLPLANGNRLVVLQTEGLVPRKANK